MHKRLLCLLAATALTLAPPAFAKEPVPKRIGQCVTTKVSELGPRLEGMPGSGSAVVYSNGLYQVSYDIVVGIAMSRVGDRAKVCLVELPQGCPKGDDRGKVYKATNLRTHKSWIAPDAEHSCGGA